MRQLDSCDFCGDAPEGVYEVVPASVAGEPKRLALCADCRDTLQSVVDPLLDAATASTAGEASAEPAVESNAADAETLPSDGSDGGSAVDDAIDGGGADSADDGVTIQSGDATDTEATTDSEAEADDGASESGDTPAGGSPARRPSGYAQLVRLLQNRDGAMPREDLRALATNAYDLGGREFENAVEAAVENGDIEETDGGLRTV